MALWRQEKMLMPPLLLPDDEAVNELFKLGDKLRASADTRKTEDSIDAQSILDEEKS